MADITSNQINTALTDRFKLTAFLSVQEQVINRLCIDNKDCVLILPTGGGKSLTYQLPSILLPYLTLVVSPLIALMKDQVESLRRKGIEAANLDSSLSTEAYSAVSRDVRNNKIKILYVSPERLNNEGFVALVKSIKISLLAIDEAHCVSEWGHSFRPEYLKLARFREEANVDRVLCLTATATEPVIADICESFGIGKDGLFKTKSYRTNLELRTYTTSTEDEKLHKLLELLKIGGDSIVYATTQKDTVHISEALNSKLGDKSSIRTYHAGMKTETRNEVQEWFMNKTSVTAQKIVVCTIAFGMGIDKSDIRQVIHYKMPKNLEGYSQEIGRAGRDGKNSICSLFINPQDVPTLQGFIRGDTPSKDSMRSLFAHIFQNSSSKEGDILQISRTEQEKLFDIRSSPLGLIYVYLDIQHHILREVTPKYTTYKYQILDSGTYTKDTSPFAQIIKKFSVKKVKWNDFDIEKAVAVGGSGRMAILEKLNEWSEQRIILKESAGVLNQYKLQRKVPDVKELDDIADDMYKQMIEKERQSIAKLQQVITFATGKECLAAHLADYFGDKDAVPEGGCQLCSWCKSEQVASFSLPLKKGLDDLKVLVKPVLAACGVRDDPKFLTRIAYGISSPRFTLFKASLSKEKKTEEKQSLEDVFGSLEEEDYDMLSEVFEQICKNCNYKNIDGSVKPSSTPKVALKRKAPSSFYIPKSQR